MPKQPRIPGLEVDKRQPPSTEQQLQMLSDRVLRLEMEVSLMRLRTKKDQGDHCRDCGWWEFMEEDPEVGDYGSCHHPTGEAQHIAHTGNPAPLGLAMEGARRACPLFERRNHA